jgi:hypothetical protein
LTGEKIWGKFLADLLKFALDKDDFSCNIGCSKFQGGVLWLGDLDFRGGFRF